MIADIFDYNSNSFEEIFFDNEIIFKRDNIFWAVKANDELNIYIKSDHFLDDNLILKKISIIKLINIGDHFYDVKIAGLFFQESDLYCIKYKIILN